MTHKDLTIAILVTFMWGINFSFIKLGLSSLDPFMLAALRFFLCAIPLVFFIKKPNVKFIYIVSYGLFFGVGLWGILYLGMHFGISAGVASIVLQLGVFFTVILSYFILKEKINLYNKIGFVLALLGILLVFLVTDGTVTLLGMLFVILSAVSWAILNIIIKKANTKDVFAFLIWSTLFPPIPLFVLAYITQGDTVFINFIDTIDSKAIISIAFQVYPTTLLGYWAWNSLLNKYPVSIVSPLSLLIPIFGLLGSFIFFNEEIGIYKILASFIILLGLTINTLGKRIFEKRGKMKLKIYQIDAFTDIIFKGNPAAVIILDDWLDTNIMQNIAIENNLSETAFAKRLEDSTYEIRWFSPITEIDFCGHATLATAFVLFKEDKLLEEVTFIAKNVGRLKVKKLNEGELEMTFPNNKPTKLDVIPKELIKGLSIEPKDVLVNEQTYFIVYSQEKDVYDVQVNLEEIKKLGPLDVTVTAQSNKYDFISRYFWPANGGVEDPVTGSMHTGLAPLWAERLNKNNLLAYQASQRGGVLKCKVSDKNVVIIGQAVQYLEGTINI